MKNGEVEIVRSGPGARANLPIDGEVVVSLWDDAPDVDLVAVAHKENVGRMQVVDRREHALEREFAAQQWAEYLKIQARA